MNRNKKLLVSDLIMTLKETESLLKKSDCNGWPDETPEEAILVIQEMMRFLNGEIDKLPQYWNIQFAVTGPIQEIAIANGWHDDYTRLAIDYDKKSGLLGSLNKGLLGK